MLPIRLVAEPDPFWRLPLWLEAMILILLTLSVLAWVYGRGVFRVFLIPFLFLLTVLPWPAVLETKLVQLMMDLVTASTAEALLWVGHPAIVVGHTLNVGQESVLHKQYLQWYTFLPRSTSGGVVSGSLPSALV